jgi:hypothetical protein
LLPDAQSLPLSDRYFYDLSTQTIFPEPSPHSKLITISW